MAWLCRTLIATCIAASRLVGSPAAAHAQTTSDAPSAQPLPPDPAILAGVNRPPKLVTFVEAVLPKSAEHLTRAIGVTLELLISDTGRVLDARVVESAALSLTATDAPVANSQDATPTATDTASPESAPNAATNTASPESAPNAATDTAAAEAAAFDNAALTAARLFQFEPAVVDGKASSAKIRYRYEFKAAVITASRLRGQVWDEQAHQPVAHISVRLDNGQECVTDETGRFDFKEVPPGDYTLTLSGNGLSALQTNETVNSGATLEVRYEVRVVTASATDGASADLDDLELLIVAPRETIQVVATRVESENARRVAGTQGDALKVVENMPGVARASAGSGDVVVWGAAPLDTRVYVDSVRVPALYHFGGLRSVVHSDLVRSVELVPGGYGATYGRGLGGLVTVDTKAPPKAGVDGSLQLDLLDASLALQSALSERVSFAAAVRRSHLRELAEKQLDARTREFFPIPRYHDAMARLRYQSSSNSFVELGGLLSGDTITRSAGGGDPLTQRSETKDLDFQRVFLRYQEDAENGEQVVFSPWVGRDHQAMRGRFGPIPIELRVDSLLAGLRASWQGTLNANLQGSVGIDAEIVSSDARRQGSTSSPSREGDARVFGQAPADQINVDTWDATTGSIAPYLTAELALFDKTLFITPGLRFEPFFTAVGRRRPAEHGAPGVGAFSADLSIQPRLAARYHLGERLTFKGAVGLYRQPPVADDLSAVFGNPLLGNASAFHSLLGAIVKITDSTSAEVTVFHSDSESLVVRNPIASPRVAEALVATGKGRANGLQLLLKRELTDHLFGWIAYTWLKSERKDSANGEWRAFDYDQTHVLTALASYELPLGFEAGVRGRVATGYPRTPVLGSFYDTRRDQFEPLLGEVNSIRIPIFWQVDARVAKRFKLAATELEVYLDVQNVTNRDNPEEIIYNADYSGHEYLRGLPVLPVLGARWSF